MGGPARLGECLGEVVTQGALASGFGSQNGNFHASHAESASNLDVDLVGFDHAKFRTGFLFYDFQSFFEVVDFSI